jgi:predicted nucleic acid-binding protein
VSDAFDSDVLIYAASGHSLGVTARRLIQAGGSAIGSLILLPETLSKPIRGGDDTEVGELLGLLARLDLKPVDAEIADASVALAAKYHLRAADSIHLATAVVWGVERFHTNNRKDFGPHMTEVDVEWPKE